MRLIPMVAWLAGLTIIAGQAPAPAAQENGVGAGLVVAVDAGGGVSAAGELPRDFPAKALRKRIPEIDLSGGVTDAGNGDANEWNHALDALTIVIPRLREGEVGISGHRIGITGTLKTGFSADDTRGAIRLALGTSWEVKLQIVESPPPAMLNLLKSADGFEINGILPAGIDHRNNRNQPPPASHSLSGENARVHASVGGDCSARGLPYGVIR